MNFLAIREYTRAASELTDALVQLRSKARSLCGPAEYQRRENIVSKCQIKLDQARAAFEEHTSEHGC
jgi:hypothetical protein